MNTQALPEVTQEPAEPKTGIEAIRNRLIRMGNVAVVANDETIGRLSAEFSKAIIKALITHDSAAVHAAWELVKTAIETAPVSK